MACGGVHACTRGRTRAQVRRASPLGRYGVLDRSQCPKLVFLDQRLPDGSDRQVVFDAAPTPRGWCARPSQWCAPPAVQVVFDAAPGVGITAESVRKFLVDRLRVPMLPAPPGGEGPTTKEEL